MSVETNIKIITANGSRLDYTTPESLGIKFNRIADDYTNPKKRWGEFSYNFSLPKTKRNEKLLQFPSASNNTRKFRVNPISVSVLNHDALILQGNLELQKIKTDTYECRFYSELTQLVDSLEDVNLQDVTGFQHIENWDYETTQRAHINANYGSSDKADYEFPLVFYNTWFTAYSTYNGLTDAFGYAFRAEGDRAMQNYYYLLNRTQTGVDGERYFHEFPICFYLKRVLEELLAHVGWSLSGSFWETESAKKIIMTYSGENDIYDQAYYTSGGTKYLNVNKFLPKYKATAFISDILTMFNMFLFVDTNNKILSMETYDTVFGSKVGAYDLTNKILADSISIEKIDNYDPSIEFDEPNNTRVMGDNNYMGTSSTNALTVPYVKTSDNVFSGMTNHIGESDSDMDVGFAAPCIKRMYLRNTDNYTGSVTSASDSIIFVPNMGEQTPQDNGGDKFNGSITDTAAYNDEESQNFKRSSPMLMYYYGISDSDFNQQSGKGDSSDYFYYDFDNTKQKIGIASPYKWQSYRDNINTELDSASSGTTSKAYAAGLQSIYMMMGDSYTGTTEYSLIFGDSHGMAETLYTKFYGNRMSRYRDSEVLSATMRLSDVDWTLMQFNQPLKYRGQIYSLMSIKNYDVTSGLASISMIKQI